MATFFHHIFYRAIDPFGGRQTLSVDAPGQGQNLVQRFTQRGLVHMQGYPVIQRLSP